MVAYPDGLPCTKKTLGSLKKGVQNEVLQGVLEDASVD
jgi:hypothetical protein